MIWHRSFPGEITLKKSLVRSYIKTYDFAMLYKQCLCKRKYTCWLSGIDSCIGVLLCDGKNLQIREKSVKKLLLHMEVENISILKI